MASNREAKIKRATKIVGKATDHYSYVGKLKEQDELDRIERAERRKKTEKPPAPKKPRNRIRTKPNSCLECQRGFDCLSHKIYHLTPTEARQYAKDCKCWYM